MTKYVLNSGNSNPARYALRRRMAPARLDGTSGRGGLPIHAMEEGRFVVIAN